MIDETTKEDEELFGTLDPLTVVELQTVLNGIVSKALSEQGINDDLSAAAHRWTRITFPRYLRRYRKLLDVSDITPQALDLDPTAAELKAELQKEQPESESLSAMLKIIDRLNDAAYMEILRHYVQREKPEPDHLDNSSRWSWAEGCLDVPQFEGIGVCYAIHDLCTHKNYSVPDLLRIRSYSVLNTVKDNRKHID